MTATKTDKTFEELLEVMREVHRRKDAAYSGDVPYSNFRRSERLGAPAHIGAGIRYLDKVERLTNMLRSEWRPELFGQLDPDDETIDDTLIDAANYCLILYLLRQEWLTAAYPVWTSSMPR